MTNNGHHYDCPLNADPYGTATKELHHKHKPATHLKQINLSFQAGMWLDISPKALKFNSIKPKKSFWK